MAKSTRVKTAEQELDPVARSVAVYTKSYLEAVYDPLVVHFSCRYAWKCPNRRVLDFYNEHVSACHLDVGVGTGYFLEKCHFPSSTPKIGLMDLNLQCLRVAAHRLRHYHPATYQANVLEPIQIDVAHEFQAAIREGAEITNEIRPPIPASDDSHTDRLRHSSPSG